MLETRQGDATQADPAINVWATQKVLSDSKIMTFSRQRLYFIICDNYIGILLKRPSLKIWSSRRMNKWAVPESFLSIAIYQNCFRLKKNHHLIIYKPNFHPLRHRFYWRKKSACCNLWRTSLPPSLSPDEVRVCLLAGEGKCPATIHHNNFAQQFALHLEDTK